MGDEHEAISRLHRHVALRYYLRSGERLRAAKARVAHGEFGPLLERDWPKSVRYAQQLMQLADPANAKRVSQLPPGTSIREAIKAIQSPRDDEPSAEQLAFWEEAERVRDERISQSYDGRYSFADATISTNHRCPRCKYEWTGECSHEARGQMNLDGLAVEP